MDRQAPPCDLKNNWIIPRGAAWTVVLAVLGIACGGSWYMSHQADTIGTLGEKIAVMQAQIDKMQGQVDWLARKAGWEPNK